MSIRVSKFEVKVCLFGCELFSFARNIGDCDGVLVWANGENGRTLARGSEASAGAFEDEDVTDFVVGMLHVVPSRTNGSGEEFLRFSFAFQDGVHGG